MYVGPGTYDPIPSVVVLCVVCVRLVCKNILTLFTLVTSQYFLSQLSHLDSAGFRGFPFKILL